MNLFRTNWLGIILIAFVIGSCKKEVDLVDEPEEPVIEVEGSVHVHVVTPENSAFSPNDLTINSIFSDNVSISDSNAVVESFVDNSFELLMAMNQSGNPTLMAYFNPSKSMDVEITIESTAIALAMFHPWTFDLSVEAKEEAVEYIKTIPEFENLKNEIEGSLIAGNDTPLDVNQIHTALINLQTIAYDRTSIDINPLQIETTQGLVGVVNVNASNSYAFGVYDNSGILVEDVKLVPSIQKINLSWQSFLDFLTNNSGPEPVPELVNIQNDGQYEIRVKSGLSFDGSAENNLAAYDNTKILVANIFGLFSGSLKDIIKKSSCLGEIGVVVFDGSVASIDISQSIAACANGNRTGYELFKDVLSFTKESYSTITDLFIACEDGGDLSKVKPSVISKLLKAADVVTRAETAFNTTNHLTEWFNNEKVFIRCLEKNEGQLNECTALEPEPLSWVTLPYTTNLGTLCDGSIFWHFSGGEPPYEVVISDLTDSSTGGTSSGPNIAGPTQIGPAYCPGNTYKVVVTEALNGESIEHTFIGGN